MSADDRELAELIRRTLPPGEPPPPVDLWPRLARRLGQRRAAVGPLDWLMAAAAAALLAVFPEALVLVLYHL